MDGKYNILLNTPMGVERGVILFKTNGSALSGIINAKGVNNEFYGGKVSGNRFEFSGEIRMLMMRIKYNATGTVEGNRLTGTVRTMYGNFSVSGTRA